MSRHHHTMRHCRSAAVACHSLPSVFASFPTASIAGHPPWLSCTHHHYQMLRVNVHLTNYAGCTGLGCARRRGRAHRPSGRAGWAHANTDGCERKNPSRTLLTSAHKIQALFHSWEHHPAVAAHPIGGCAVLTAARAEVAINSRRLTLVEQPRGGTIGHRGTDAALQQ